MDDQTLEKIQENTRDTARDTDAIRNSGVHWVERQLALQAHIADRELEVAKERLAQDKVMEKRFVEVFGEIIPPLRELPKISKTISLWVPVLAIGTISLSFFAWASKFWPSLFN